MRGSIQKKGKTHFAVLAINGKRKWFRGGLTKKDAQRVLTEKLAEIDQGTYKEIPKLEFKKYAELWLKSYAEAILKPSTLELYKIIVEKHLIPAWEGYPLAKITTIQIQNYISDRLKVVSPKTVKNEVAVIKEMFKHAYRWGYIKINPAEHVQRPKVDKHEIEILTPSEVAKLLKNTTPAYRLAFQTAVMTGMRAGELWGLQWGDIDWNSGQIHVRRSIWGGKFQTPKSGTSVRKLDVPDSLLFELRAWKLRCPISKHDLVFPNTEGNPSVHNTVITSHFNPALRRAGLKKVSFHSFRHTNASLRIQAGQNVKYLSTQLGHSSINITMDRYGHLFNDLDFTRKQVDLLEASFRSVRNPLEKGVPNEKGANHPVANPLIFHGAEAGI